MGGFDDYDSLLLIGCVVSISIIFYMLTTMGSVFQIANNIDNSPCSNIVIKDKFTNVNGWMFDINTNYYITDDKNLTYKMWICGNITEIGEWNRIVVGNAYGIRISGSDATFCNSQKLLF